MKKPRRTFSSTRAERLARRSSGNAASTLAFDQQHLWHPYEGLPSQQPRYGVKRASGCEIELLDGRKLVDGTASWWTAVVGYQHPQIVQALQEQAGKLSHVMFGGLTHEPAVELAKRLLLGLPDELNKVFFCDSGSVSVEVALKMARQVARSRGRTDRQRIMTVRRGYHGDTLGAMSVCDPGQGMHRHCTHTVPEQIFLPAPRSPLHGETLAEEVAELEAAFRDRHNEACAFVLEPVVQNAGGVRFYSPDYLRHLRRLCDAYDTVLVFDEIATGFHRTGPRWACEHAGVWPDILCLGKALSGGAVSLAATVTTDAVAHAIRSAPPGVLMHGPTFMANPLACAAARATLDVLDSMDAPARVAAIESQLTRELAEARPLPGVADVRALGAIGAIEMSDPVSVEQLVPRAVELGVWLRPFGRVIYCMPPLTISPSQLSQVTAALCELARLAGGHSPSANGRRRH